MSEIKESESLTPPRRCAVHDGLTSCPDCERQNEEDEWVMTSEPFRPLYIGPLPHNVKRMLQALDGYWAHCDGWTKKKYPRSQSTAEDWWIRFEKYRSKVEAEL